MSDPRIKLSSVSKSFRLPHEKHTSLKASVINLHKRSYEKLDILKNINLEITDGEFFGIIGRNGSGKSTLLKILAGIYKPTGGKVSVMGKLTPFIELGVGFNSELTGRDNVYLNGALLGLSRHDIEEKYEEIVEFAELEKFMDQKLKNYSSGMQVRLAFSVAIQAHSDILLIDEVLAVGDLNFQQKCYDYFYKLKENKRTVVLVTHDMSIVREYCDQGVVLHDGRIITKGAPSRIIAKYQNLNLISDKSQRKAKTPLIKPQSFSQEASITNLATVDNDRKAKHSYRPHEKIIIGLDFVAHQDLKHPLAGIAVNNEGNAVVFASDTTKTTNLEKVSKNQKYHVEFEIENVFTDGEYVVSAAVDNAKTKLSYARLDTAVKFEISGWDFKHAQTHPRHTVIVSKKD